MKTSDMIYTTETGLDAYYIYPREHTNIIQTGTLTVRKIITPVSLIVFILQYRIQKI